MPDKKPTDVTDIKVGKMTDNEVIKALECYRGQKLFAFNGKKPEIYIHDILDLINRLQAENEELKREIEDLERVQEISPEAKYLVDTKADKVISLLTEINKSQEQIKAEAYKECIEKVKEISKYEIYCDNQLPEPITTYHITEDTLDNLLKELVGEK